MRHFQYTSIYIIMIFCITLIFMESISIAKDSDVIVGLTKKIAKSKSEAEKSRLYMYRARNYNNIGEYEKARDDYDDGLTYNHQGWIHLERGRFFMAQKNYEQAIREAVAAEKETPTLKKESQKIISQASKAFKKKLQSENPQEILLTTVWQTKTVGSTKRQASKKSGVRAAYAAKNKTASSRTRSVSRS